PILLIVDDDPGIVSLIERFAEPLSFTVVAHTSPRVALSSLLETKPDIALVDLQMPDVDGLDVLRHISTNLPTCQVSLMSGHPTAGAARADGAGDGRDRSRQGAGVAGTPQARHGPGAAPRGGELFGSGRDVIRKRAVRPCARRLHGRHGDEGRAVRAGRRRHA